MIKPSCPPPPSIFLLTHPSHLVACGFGSGLSPVAPGTVGTLIAWLIFLPMNAWIDKGILLGLIALCFVIGFSAVERAGKDLGATDHGSIVWDEIVPFWLVLWYCPPGFFWQLGAFVIFRIFDILKPQPARFFDEKIKNGFGVMMDDLVAAVYSIALLTFLQYLINRL